MFLSKYFPFELKTRILLLIKKFYNTDFELAPSDKKKAFVFLAADYGNLGDVAITYAQTEFLRSVLPDYEVIDVPISKTLDGISIIQSIVKPHDIVTTVGGGNLGDLYDQIEFYRQLVVESFPENKIISFPQTIDFSDTEKGKKALSIAAKRYSKHKNLTFVAREKISYKKMKEVFKNNNVILSPDIVLSLNKSEPKLKRKGIVYSLRKDAEKSLSSEDEKVIKDLVAKHYSNVRYYDTHIGVNNLSLKEREEELSNIWNVFKGAELVITDRLHGMIFCYITGTPCIVFQNNNHKVKGSFQWIKKSGYINLIDEFSEDKITDILKEDKDVIYTSLINDYKKMVDIIFNES